MDIESYRRWWDYTRAYDEMLRMTDSNHVWAAAAGRWRSRLEALEPDQSDFSRAATRDQVERYKVEPYVVSADIYGAPPAVDGPGTPDRPVGSIARALEAILGFRQQGRFLLRAVRTAGWPAYEIAYRYGSATYRIRFDNAKGIGRGVHSVTLDGEPVANENVPLLEVGRVHEVHELVSDHA